MENQEKIGKILEAVQAGMSRRALDKAGKGKAVAKLERGEKLSEAKLDELYLVACGHAGNQISQKRDDLPNSSEKSLDNLSISKKTKLEWEIAELRKLDAERKQELKRLREKVADLEQKLSNGLGKLPHFLDKNLVNGKENHCLGFQLVEKAIKGKSYWYAVKSLGKKLIWVYVGLDREQAQAKINGWLNRNHEKAAKLGIIVSKESGI